MRYNITCKSVLDLTWVATKGTTDEVLASG